MELGYAISSEEHAPSTSCATRRGPRSADSRSRSCPDHFHPWTDRQGQSPFVWSVLGGIGLATERLVVGTGVTCPTIRIHPAIVAQAAATAASMLPGRFFLGVGTGENLNEHVLGQRWPATEIRREMLEEAIEVMRDLWRGELTSHRGRHYTVENARITTLPDEPIDVMVAAAARGGRARRSGRDGLVATAPAEAPRRVRRRRGDGKPRTAR